jgi:hypothetical protein
MFCCVDKSSLSLSIAAVRRSVLGGSPALLLTVSDLLDRGSSDSRNVNNSAFDIPFERVRSFVELTNSSTSLVSKESLLLSLLFLGDVSEVFAGLIVLVGFLELVVFLEFAVVLFECNVFVVVVDCLFDERSFVVL